MTGAGLWTLKFHISGWVSRPRVSICVSYKPTGPPSFFGVSLLVSSPYVFLGLPRSFSALLLSAYLPGSLALPLPGQSRAR